MRYPTFDEIRGPLERVILIWLTWAVTKGYIMPADVITYSTLAIGIISALYGWWQNRPEGIVISTAALNLTQKELSEAVAAAKKPMSSKKST